MTLSSIQNAVSRTGKTKAVVEDDFYTEPEWCVDLLFDAEPFVGCIYDPCAGAGTIPRIAFNRGFSTFASDLRDRDIEGVEGDLDFLYNAPVLLHPENIIFNPPYKHADDFIRRALDIATIKVAALVQQKFPFSQRRYRLFQEHPPARIYFLSDRPSMPPGEALLAGTIKAKGGTIDYLWMVWDRGHKGATTAHWLCRGKS